MGDDGSRDLALLDFWFADALEDPVRALARLPVWFGRNESFDEELERRFAGDAARAAAGELEAWRATPRGELALVLLLDQLPRNLHRGSARAFACDAAAFAVCSACIESFRDRRLSLVERAFCYMPLQHAEDRSVQDRSLGKYERLLANAAPEWQPVASGFRDYAHEHREIVMRFGRFPHRNEVLGRDSTDEELAWLASGGARWGQ